MGAKLGGSGGGKYEEEANSSINVTPFVDVMLVLLIIFMVAAPLAAVTVKVALPPAVAKPGTNPPKPVYISIQSNGRIFIQDFMYGDFMGVMNMLQDNGFYSVALVGEDKNQ